MNNHSLPHNSHSCTLAHHTLWKLNYAYKGNWTDILELGLFVIFSLLLVWISYFFLCPIQLSHFHLIFESSNSPYLFILEKLNLTIEIYYSGLFTGFSKGLLILVNLHIYLQYLLCHLTIFFVNGVSNSFMCGYQALALYYVWHNCEI